MQELPHHGARTLRLAETSAVCPSATEDHDRKPWWNKALMRCTWGKGGGCPREVHRCHCPADSAEGMESSSLLSPASQISTSAH